MKITALVENQTKGDLKAAHGLSLYVETKKHRLLFDLGPEDVIFDNAETLGIDLEKVDLVIISHGHDDHGGALRRFLEVNQTAKVYVQKKAFEPHYSRSLLKEESIGLDETLLDHSRLALLEGDCQIDEELLLFTLNNANKNLNDADKCYSSANDTLYAGTEKDDFSHEQNLIIREGKTALIMGCGHKGVVNIMEKAAPYNPVLCVGGYHLFNSATKKTVDTVVLGEIAKALKPYQQTQFYTCHCTGTEAFQYLSQQMPNLSYLSCGETIEI